MKNLHTLTLRAALTLGVSATVLTVLSGPVFAQPATAPAAKDSGIETMIVTANRREESLQKVAITATSISGDTLERANIKSINDIRLLAPALVIFPHLSLSNSTYAIRGQTLSDSGNIGIDSPVGIYSDDIYVARNGGSGTDLFDLERIEVLEGPQGTLFGRNTVGGAIKFVTRKPDVQSFNGYVKGTYNFIGDNKLEGDAVINLPIVKDKLAVRLATRISSSDGFYRNNFTGNRIDYNDSQSVRLGVLFKPTERFDVLFQGDYTHSSLGAVALVPRRFYGDTTPITAANVLSATTLFRNVVQVALEDGMPTSFLNNNAGRAINNVAALPYLQAAQAKLQQFGRLGLQNPNEIAANFDNTNLFGPPGTDSRDPKSEPELGGGALTLTYDGDFATIRSITGYRTSVLPQDGDYDGTPYHLLSTYSLFQTSQVSQEVLANGSLWDDVVKWTVGALYFQERSHLDTRVVTHPSINAIPDAGTVGVRGTPSWVLGKAKSYAGYAQVTVSPWKRLHLTGGTRYTHDYRYMAGTLVAQFTDGSDGCGIPTALINAPNCTQTSDATFNKLTYSGAIQFDITDDKNVYVRTGNGFRSGGFAGRTPFSATPFQPELVTDYEAGFKGYWFNRHLQTNFSAFVTYQSEIQAGVAQIVTVTAPDSSGNVHSVPLSSTVSRNIGDQKIYGTQLQVSAKPFPWLDIAGSWVHQESHANVAVLPGGNDAFFLPKNAVTFTTAFHFPALLDWATIDYRVDYSYRSSMLGSGLYSDPTLRPDFFRTDNQNVVNMDLTFTTPRGVELSIFAQNVLNESYDARQLSVFHLSVTPGTPRVVGASIKLPFGEDNF